jgi:uncharacterized protein
MEEMKVGVGDIRKSKGLSKSFTWDGDCQLRGINLDGPLNLDLKVTNAVSRIMVTGPLQTRVRLECSRCAEEVIVPIEVKLEEEFLPAGSEEARVRASDLLDETFTFEDDQIELEELLRQEIEAAFPIKVLCQSNCRGLCSECGTNLNHESCNCSPEEGDSRWSALKQWTGGTPPQSSKKPKK